LSQEMGRLESQSSLEDGLTGGFRPQTIDIAPTDIEQKGASPS
jgi:hypothetical protein